MLQMNTEECFERIRSNLPGLDYGAGLNVCAGDRDFYLEILKDFTELPIRKELDKFLKEKNTKNYCVSVHGFKNNAYSVGAKEIGDLAYELEKAAKEEKADAVPAMQKHMFELYEDVCRRYKEAMGS